MAAAKNGSYGVVTFSIRADGESVAKKVLDSERVFKHEVGIMRELQGLPHVMSILEANEEDLSYTMQGFDTDLFTFVYTNLLSLDMVVRLRVVRGIMRRVLTGLGHIHRRGFVHMDLKAPNVVLSVKDKRVTRVAIADFGTALRVGTKIERPEGTPGSMPPEVLAASPESPVAVKTSMDMYSVGVMTATVLSGQVKTGDAIVCAAALAPGLAPLISALTHADPSQRPSAEEALELMDALSLECV